MDRRVSTNFAVMSILIDIAAAVLSFSMAVFLTPPSLDRDGLFTISICLIWPLVFLMVAVYDHVPQWGQLQFWIRLLLGNLMAGTSIVAMLIVAGAERYDPFFLWFFVIIFLTTAVWRMAFAGYVKATGPAHWEHPTLIVGTDRKARDLFDGLRRQPALGFLPVGLIAAKEQDADSGPEILGELHDLRGLIEAYSIRDLVVALPANETFLIDSILMETHTLPVQIWAFPDYLEAAIDSKSFEQRGKWPFTQFSTSALSGRQRLVKRCFDLGISCLLLPFSLIAIEIIALAIRLEGPGPVLFRQKRVGENGKLFELFKLRTMFPHAEAYRYLVEHYDPEGNLIHKAENDPRVTRVGHFLRRTSLDELPQLFNILLGNMSLVGPRPELPYLVERYQPWQRKRFSVPPGLTCWWQVNGRSNRPMHLHTEDDIFYIDHYSFYLDLKIVLKTIAVVLRGKGAY